MFESFNVAEELQEGRGDGGTRIAALQGWVEIRISSESSGFSSHMQSPPEYIPNLDFHLLPNRSLLL